MFTYTVNNLDNPEGGEIFLRPKEHTDLQPDLQPFDLVGDQSIKGRLGRNANLDTIEIGRTYTGHMVNGTIQPPAAAGPPQNLRAYAGNGRIDMDWDEPSGGTPAGGYRVRWRESSEPAFAASDMANITTGTEHSIRGLSDGEAHVVQVASLDASSDPGDWVEAQATVGRPKAVSNLTVQTRNQDFRLSWDAPDERGADFLQDADGDPVLVYRVSWEETGQESDAVPYQKVCQTGTAAFDFYEYHDVEQSGNSITFKLRPPGNGDVYSFDVEARFQTGSAAVLDDCRNQSNFGPEAETTETATEDAAMASEEDHVAVRAALEAVVDDRDENWPWLRTAWAHASAGTVQAADLDQGTQGKTGAECTTGSNSTDNLGGCTFGRLEIDIDWDLLTQERFEYLAVHELAHVWTLVTDLHVQNTRGPVGRAVLYFLGQEYEGSSDIMAVCATETLADAISHLAEGVAPADLAYYGDVCFSDGRTEPAVLSEGVALHAMHPSGADPNGVDTTSSWFTDTFTGDAASADAWEAVSDIESVRHRFLVMNLLRDEFNGLCSTKAGNVAASADSDITDPWMDGGCEPDAPTVTAVPGPLEGSIELSVTAPADGGAPLLSYEVQWRTTGQTWGLALLAGYTKQVDAPETPEGILNLTPGGSYVVRVMAKNSIGDSEFSDEISVTAAATGSRSTPPPPQNVRAVEEKGGVRLTWQPPDGSAVTGYRIERRPAGEQGNGPQRSHGRPRDHHTLVEDTGSADTGYTDESAEKGVAYEYRVSARNESGPGEGSDWVRAGPESASNSPATGAPTIRGTTQVGETLTADITGIADADGLSGETFIYQWVSGDGTTDTDMENATGSTYTLAAADQGRSVKVRVTFTDGAGNEETLTSAPTAPVWGDGLPGAPRNLTATPGNKEITLSWDPPADNGNAPATRYRIEWRVEGKDYDKNHWGTSRSTTYTTNDQANLANGVKYFFRVKAENDNGYSHGPYGPASEEVSATPTSGSAVNLGTPVLSDTEILHHGMVRLDWEDVEDAGWYVVQYYHVEDGEWLDLPAEGVDIAFHGSSAVVSNLHGLSWLRVGAASCGGESEWSQIEELYGTNASDWEGVPVPEVAEGDEIEPCPVVLGTPVLSEPEYLHHGMVQLDWQDIEDAGWYVVQYYHLEGGEWLDLPAEGVEIEFHGSSAVVSNLHGLSWLRVGAASCDGASEWSQIEELYGTKESDWDGVPVPEVAEGDEIEPCDEDADTSDNSPATGVPTISGTAQVGETLTANASGIADEDGLTNATYSFQWLADDTEIAGATSLTYTLADTDEGKAIKVEVSFTDDAGNGETLTSTATDAVAAAPAANSPATGVPTISGTAQAGETLTANTSGIADEDGLDEVSFTYQWLADDSDISGATNATYTLVDADEGKAIKVEVTFTDDAGYDESLTSEATEAVAATPTPGNTPATGAPTISGTARAGEVLEVDTSGIADEDGLANVSFTYQWLADDSDISGATSATYTPVAEDEGKAIKVRVSFIDDAGNGETLTSEPTAVAAAALPPPPDNLRAVTQKSGAVELTWDAPQEATVTGYRIERRPTGGSPSDQQRSDGSPRDQHTLVEDTGSADTGYTDNTAQEGVGYQYRVSARNEAGAGEESDWVNAEEATASNSPATGAPTITGTAQVGETLTANTSGIADEDGLSSVQYEYQWLADGADISGATSSTYTLAAADEGKTIKVQVSFTDDAGNPEAHTGAPTDVVQPPAASPAITGTARVGETLTVDTSPISDTDGLEDAVFAYQWIAGGADIEGATGASYTIIAEDEGLIIRVWVSFTDDGGNHETRTSDGTEAVEAAPQPDNPATGNPAIRGKVQVGETLTADTSGIADEDGLDNVSFSYQWIAGGMDIAGETGAAYTLTEEDEGMAIQVWVSFTDDAGNEETLTSPATDAVAAQPTSNSPATGAPTITGTVQVGETLTANTSGIEDADGLSNVQYEYQWLADDSEIAGATGLTYTLVDVDEGKAIKVQVSFTDDADNEESLASAATDALAAAPQTNSPATGAPTITGAVQVGETLTADTSGIADADGLSNVQYEYQWLANDSDIAGATGLTYTLVDTDEGKAIKVQVSFTDDAGNGETDQPGYGCGGGGAQTLTAQVGETLTADTSGIADADGLSNVQYEYQWLANDSDIAGATGLTYTLVDTDEGKAIKVQVSFTDDAGNGETLTSPATDAVAAAPTPNSPATGAPTISGTAQVGETLTADTSGIADADGLSNVQYEYQWLADDSDISGATNATYTLADTDEGKAIKVQVSFTDDADNEESLTSAATDAVSAAPTPNSPATGAPTISGTAQVGETLTADTSGIADADGLSNVQYEYQWLADDAEIAGATSLTYTLAETDEGKAIKVEVTFTDDAGNEETLTSAATDAVATAEPSGPPDKPKGLEATATHDSVTLTWNDPEDDTITGYVILRRVRVNDQGGDFSVLVANTGNAATTYTDDTVAASTTYTYRIKAINQYGASERSRWVHIDTPAPPVPDKPAGLEATASHGQVVLTWDDPQDESITGYVILRRVRVNDQGGDFSELVANTGSAATTYTDNEVAASTTYTYRIKAINEYGVSERSRWVHIDTPAAP